jgi:hypothetical protein
MTGGTQAAKPTPVEPATRPATWRWAPGVGVLLRILLRGVPHRRVPGERMSSAVGGGWGGIVTARPVERACYAVGAMLIASGLVHLGVLLVTGGSWQGPVSWRKPMTFGVSFGLTLITIAWVASYIRLGRRTRGWLLSLFAGACVLEVSLITLQAWRRVPSHFNLETSFDGSVARVLAAGGAVLIAVIALLSIASWRADPQVAPSMRLAVRAGLVALDVAVLVGAVMIATGISRALGGDQQAAYVVGGALKPAHAVTMHAVLVLPALAWLLARAGWPEHRRVQVVWLAVAGYALLAGVVVAESIAGVSPLQGPGAATTLAAAGGLAVGAAGLVSLLAHRRRPS